MNLNPSKIILIIIISSLIGLVVNFINPEGISLIREKKDLAWADDSLFNIANTDSSENIIEKTEEESSKTPIKEIQTPPNELKEKEENSNEKHEQTLNQKEITTEKTKVESFEKPKAITLEQAYTLYKHGVTFIDARDPADYEAGHIVNSINIPFEDSDNYKTILEKLNKDKPVVTYCAGTDCDLSILLGDELFEKGYKRVYVFFGGWLDWLNAKYPTESSVKNETEQK